jgi:hypothetical protein
MIVYHVTHEADGILTDGFRDGEGTYMTANVHRGVWVSDVPLDVNEGAVGDRLLAIDVPETVIADFEWVEDDKAYREWLVPAEVLNRFPVTEVIDFWNV